ncbi:MAG: hypothetical protein NXI31_16940 [bacterium]|nr:hypothetical protein [bacterium]
MASTQRKIRWTSTALVCGWLLAIVACSVSSPQGRELHRWWAGFGMVVKHDSFPADCKLCHLGESWNDIVETFEFDHEKSTGVALNGAHGQAKCLRCHNDRGPVAVFANKGCAGCHEDVHYGELGKDCASCHDENAFHVPNARVRHLHGRFPLTGAHMQVACHRCHSGAFVRNFRPTDPNCESCHFNDAAGVNNPPHINLGWVDRCDRCHIPTSWRPAVVR